MQIDTTLAERVEGAIVANPYVSSRHLRFETAGGRVVLSGIVPTYFQKQMAQEIVRRIEGVHEIDNCLEVSWLPPEPALVANESHRGMSRTAE
jgi:osmotically-inducible protein OsmY